MFFYCIISFIYFREPRRKDFEFDRGESDRYRNYDRFKGSGNYDRRRNESYRVQEEPEWMTGNYYSTSKILTIKYLSY